MSDYILPWLKDYRYDGELYLFVWVWIHEHFKPHNRHWGGNVD